MIRFYKQHADHIKDKHALCIIHDKIEEAKCEEARGEDYTEELSDAYNMIADLLHIKNINIALIRKPIV